MAISDSDIAQVRSATDIVALISDHVALKKSGRRWSGLCPFHGEKTPSFSVNAEEGRYYCFGCRASGDQITFVREIQHLDFIEAVRLLADRAGIELHEDANTSKARKERQELMEAMERAVEWYHDRLLHAPDARAARDYLRSRGISGEVARQFKLGWAPDEWDALAKELKLNERVLTGTGLGFVNKRDRPQDALRARLIFPIYDPAGKAVAVGGRILASGAEAQRPDGRVEPKYKNSPETPIYSKRRTLYALNWAKDDVIKSGEIIVCEGYTDVIAFFGAGLPRAVATCGTALGEEHFRTMRNFARRIVLAYDADQAGQSAAASVYQWERQHEVDVAVARLPKGTDPAELAQNDPAALRKAVADAVPFLQFRLERVLESANVTTAEGRARAAELAVAVLAEHPSDLVRDQYIMQVADRLRIEAAALRPRVAAVARGEVRRPIANEPPGETASSQRASEVPLPRPGQEALRLCVHHVVVKERLVAAYFVNDVQREIFESLLEEASISDSVDQLRRRGEEMAAEVLSRLAVDELDRDYGEADIAAVVSQLVRAAVYDALKSLERELREGTVAPDVANATIRDVKQRLEMLSSAQGDHAEHDLREWLVGRSMATPT
ncbi:MAG TPA: DNA primase [Acidimicrobiales bacterium]|nr:DNA primase [Acidimicrobiales bacterium]